MQYALKIFAEIFYAISNDLSFMLVDLITSNLLEQVKVI